MNTHAQEMITLVAELRSLCSQPAGDGIYDRVEGITTRIQQAASLPLVAALALDVRFKAQDVFRGPQLMPEPVLREMLTDRLHRLEATLRATLAREPVVPLERRGAGGFGRRASDRMHYSRPAGREA